MSKKHCARFLGYLLTAIAASAPAADRGEDEPIQIEARSVEANDKTGTVVYSGNVRAEQGDLSIQADRVEIHTREGKTQLIRATGKPAKLRQRAAQETDDIKAHATRVDYHVSTKKIGMFGNVSLRRGKDWLTADTLHYDIASQSLNASGEEKGDGRVHAVIQPSSAKSPP